MTDWLSTTQAAAYLQCSTDTIYHAIARRGLKALKVGKGWKINREWLDAWMESQVVNPGRAERFRRVQ